MLNQLKLKNSTKIELGIDINDLISYNTMLCNVDTLLLGVRVAILETSELRGLSQMSSEQKRDGYSSRRAETTNVNTTERSRGSCGTKGQASQVNRPFA